MPDIEMPMQIEMIEFHRIKITWVKHAHQGEATMIDALRIGRFMVLPKAGPSDEVQPIEFLDHAKRVIGRGEIIMNMDTMVRCL